MSTHGGSDGEMGKDEYEGVLEHFGVDVDEETDEILQMLFDEVANGDGKITEAELTQYFNEVAES